MSSDEISIPPLWTAVEVACLQSHVYRGYICAASDTERPTLALCSFPENKLVFVYGDAINSIEVSPRRLCFTCHNFQQIFHFIIC